MYNNYSNFLNNPYTNPYNPVSSAGINSPYQPGKQEIIKVNGKEGANAYPLNIPNSSVLMLDINQPILYVKISDGAGYCNITSYTISPLKEVINDSGINTDDLEKRIKRLEELYESYTLSLEQLTKSKSSQSDKQR